MTPAELRAWRIAHDLTQAQAADWVGISRRLWIRFEKGHRPIPKWLRIIVTSHSRWSPSTPGNQS